MRGQTRDLLAKLIEQHGPFQKVLDVGSMHINGNVKDLFGDSEYTGVDMRDGENVDKVVNGHYLHEVFDKDSFDLVICVDTFEHDDAFWLTLENCKQVLKPGGFLFLGAPSRACPEHDHPHDYWRFMPQSMELMLDGFEDIYTEAQMDDPNHHGHDEIYGWGRKP